MTIEVLRKSFRVRHDPGEASVRLDLETFSQPLLVEVGVDTLAEFDRMVSLEWDGLSRRGDVDRLSWTAKSTLWSKRYHLDVHPGHLELHAEVHGCGRVDVIRYFDAIADAGFRPHFALTKHFNDKSETGSRTYSVGSPVAFRRVLCPEPNSYANQLLAPHEFAQVSVNADVTYQGGNFVANPGLLAFAVAAEPDREWLAMGLAVRPGEHLFSSFDYLGGESFALALSSWGARRFDGLLHPPGVVLVPGRTAQDALRGYTAVLRGAGLVPRRSGGPRPGWWSRPILCGWGHQSYQGDLFRIRNPHRPPDNAVYMLCTQANYRDIVERLEDLPWGTLVVDSSWFGTGGLMDVDEGRWPDLRGFVAGLHRQGRRVLLWWGPWATDGLPTEQCVLCLPGHAAAGGPRTTGQNRPHRRAKFVPASAKVAVDITLPAARERLRAQVRRLLGPPPDGYDADGFKLDHLVGAPGQHGMVFPDGSGELFGIEAAHEYLALLYETAKEVKPDALIIGQSPNPYFADVQDMLRLGDTYCHDAESVLAEMRLRADLARIADPDCLVDTDGWPMPSLAALREYAAAQPSLGVPSLYYASHLDTTGEPLTSEDFALLRRSWSTG